MSAGWLRIALVGLVLSPLPCGTAIADASNGEFLGYRLGESYAVPKRADVRNHINGAVILDIDPGEHDHHVDSITLFLTPDSSVVGSIFGEWYFPSQRTAKDFATRYLDNLKGRYSDWKRSGSSLTNGDYQLWSDFEQKPPIIEHWPSRHQFRVTIGLIYAPDTLGRYDWMALLDKEVNKRELTARH